MNLNLLDGTQKYLHHGAIGVLYYFGILEGQMMSCKYFDVGSTRPFLSDELTRYKIGLEAEFSSDRFTWQEYLWLGVNEQLNPSKEFVPNNPFIFLNEDYGLNKHNI